MIKNMQNDQISSRNACCLIITMIISSTILLGVPSKAGQDSWISLLLSMAAVTPLVLIYARMIKLIPGKNIFEMLQTLFGKLFGGLMIVLFLVYAAFLGAMITRNFTEFVGITSLPQTPKSIIMLSIILVTLYLGKMGMNVLGKWAAIILMVSLAIIISTILFSLRFMNPSNLMPVMEHNIKEIAYGSLSYTAFPFGETVLVLALAGAFGKKSSPYKIYVLGAVAGAFVLLITFFRSVMVLGPETMDAVYFPSYTAARVIKAGSFLERMESLIYYNFILAGITKIAVCIHAVSIGSSILFGLNKNNNSHLDKFILPFSALLILIICSLLYSNVMEMFEFLEVYMFYALPFQAAIPLLMWITAEIKNRKSQESIETAR